MVIGSLGIYIYIYTYKYHINRSFFLRLFPGPLPRVFGTRGLILDPGNDGVQVRHFPAGFGLVCLGASKKQIPGTASLTKGL